MKISAFGSLILIFAVIAVFFIPAHETLLADNAGILAAASHEKAKYEDVRAEVDVPPELPFDFSFDINQTTGDFTCDVKSNVSSGYYSKPQLLKLTSSYELYYTTDGTLPDENSLKYDPDVGINIDSNMLICVRAKDNDKFSDVMAGSYVIFKDATSYKYAYGYNSLDSLEQYVYEKLYDTVVNFDPVFEVGNLGINYSQLCKIMFCVNYDNPMLFQMSDFPAIQKGTKDNVKEVYMYYLFDEDECKTLRESCQKRVDEIMSEADGSISLMDYIYNVHYSILDNAVYLDDPDDENIYDAYGVLVKGTGVCESYSRAFEYICQRMGVDNILVNGVSDDVPHMWNMIKFGDEWYHIDLTWDDGDDGNIYYDYFNVSDDIIEQYGYREISPPIGDGEMRDSENVYNYYELPVADSMEYNYSYYYYGETYDEVYY